MELELSKNKKYNLDTAPNIGTLYYINEESWHELRSKGIGGSDVGALMQLSTYSSPLKVFKNKVYGNKPFSNKYTRKGIDLEPLIFEKYVRPYFEHEGYVVQQPEDTFINSKYPMLRANLDGIAHIPDTKHTENIVVEIKTVSEHAETTWNGYEYNGVPATYYAQVQHYMAVTETKKAILFALFDSTWEVKTYEILRNDIFIEKMLGTVDRFYKDNITPGIAPAPILGIDKEEIIEMLSEGKPETTINNEIAELAIEYAEAHRTSKEAENVKKIIGGRLAEMWAKGERTDAPTVKFSCSLVTSNRFDKDKFIEKYGADEYNQLCTESVSSRINVKVK